MPYGYTCEIDEFAYFWFAQAPTLKPSNEIGSCNRDTQFTNFLVYFSRPTKAVKYE